MQVNCPTIDKQIEVVLEQIDLPNFMSIKTSPPRLTTFYKGIKDNAIVPK